MISEISIFAFLCEKTWWCKRQSNAGLGVICMNFSLLIAPDGQSWGVGREVAVWMEFKNQIKRLLLSFYRLNFSSRVSGVLASDKRIKKMNLARQKDKKTKGQKDKKTKRQKDKKTKRQKDKKTKLWFFNILCCKTWASPVIFVKCQKTLFPND